MKNFRGKKHEDLKCFRKDDGKAYAYQWNMIENGWTEIGEVMGEQGVGGGNILFTFKVIYFYSIYLYF